jgi:hypothetical protein
MSTRAAITGLVLAMSLFLAGSCGSNSSPTTPTTDFIALDSIAPAAGTPLKAGDRVTFTAVVTCTIVSSTGGFTTMLLADQFNRLLTPADEPPQRTPLSKGTATVTLSNTITIPASGTVRVALPIFINESNSTAAAVTRDYPVQ